MTSGFYEYDEDILSKYLSQDYMLNAFPGNSFTSLYTSVQAFGSSYSGQLGDLELSHLLPVFLPVANVSQVAAGDGHVMVVKADGTVWGIGDNSKGQLGNGTLITRYTTFQQATNISNVKQLVCGSDFTYALKYDGTVVACGSNYYDQLGVPDGGQYNTFNAVPGLSNIVQLVCGGYHVIALKEDGTILVCGNNDYGQLGIGAALKASYFTIVPTTTPIKFVAAGTWHSMLITSNDALQSAGINTGGALGLGENYSTIAKVTTFTDVPNTVNVKYVACGNNITMTTRTNGMLFVCGTSTVGALGLKYSTSANTLRLIPEITNVKRIAFGSAHTAIFTTDGKVLTTGYNISGQLGTGDAIDRTTFQQITQVNNIKQLACYGSTTLLLTTPANWM
jgi:alpha-tubulin suppressor-like RCC1 family protein